MHRRFLDEVSDFILGRVAFAESVLTNPYRRFRSALKALPKIKT